MENLLYNNSMMVLAIIHLIFGVYTLATHIPKDDLYANYRIARRAFGILEITSVVYIAVSILFDLKDGDPILFASFRILFFLTALTLFLIMYCSLLKNEFLQHPYVLQKFKRILFYFVALIVNYFWIPLAWQEFLIKGITICYFIEFLSTIIFFFRLFDKTVSDINNYYSDEVEVFIHWISKGIYAMAALGVLGVAIAFIPKIGLVIFGIASTLICAYTTISLNNYLLNLANVSKGVDLVEPSEQTYSLNVEVIASLQENIKIWVGEKKFTQVGITMEDLARDVASNRTYVAAYIKEFYKMTYREWICDLRISYAKEILRDELDLPIAKVAERVGYTRTSFITAFTKHSKLSPANWRKKIVEQTLKMENT